MIGAEKIFDLQRFATYSNYGKYSVVSGSDYADTVNNYAGGATIRGYGGNDSIYNSTSSSYTINSSYGYVTIDGGDGSDTIYSNDPYVSINGGYGNDSINFNSWRKATIRGGYGNDTIYGNTNTISTGGALYQYYSGEGSDLIQNWSSSDTISIGGGNYTRATVGSNVVLGVGSSSITLSGASGKTVNVIGTTTPSGITNYGKYSVVSGTDSANTIRNYAGGATIRGYGGNDSIFNSTSSSYTINSSYGYVTIDGGDGADNIYSNDPRVSINGGYGNDSINASDSWNGRTIRGGYGNDTIYGNTVSSGYGILYQYYSGDGSDLIQNWSSYDTISIGGGNYTRATVGSNVVLGVGSSSITLSGASGKTVNVIGSTIPSSSGINNYGKYSLVSGTSSNDSIRNYAGGATIQGGDGNDSLYNSTDSNYTINSVYGYVTMNGGYGNDTLKSNDPRVSLNGGAGNDLISIFSASAYRNITIKGGTGYDTIYGNSLDGGVLYQYSSGDDSDIIYNYSSSDTISLDGSNYTRSTVGSSIVLGIGSGSITLSGASGKTINVKNGNLVSNRYKSNSTSYATVTGSSYADTISNSGSYSRISTGGGNDSIYNTASSTTISAGDGNDKIYSYNADAVSINGGAGNDRISLGSSTGYYGWRPTVRGGTGNDTIYNSSLSSNYDTGSVYGAIYQYSSGDGSDIIYGWTSNDTVSLDGSNYTRSTVGSSIVLGIGSGSITLSGASGKTINVRNGNLITNRYKSNSTSYASVTGSSSKDTIYNSGSNSTIRALGGNDSIYNSGAYYTKIYGGDGADTITNYNGYYSYVDGGASSDYISVKNDYVTINGGDGNDTIRGDFAYSSVNGGAGNDSIYIYNYYNVSTKTTTVKGGTGNDTLYGYSSKEGGSNYNGILYQYASGDGYDLIQNWSSYDTISLGGGNYRRSTIGSSVVISMSGGAITLSGAKGKTINVTGGTRINTNNPNKKSNSSSYSVVSGTSNNDTISNSGSYSTINAGSGNDSIYNTARYANLNGGDGKDTIYNKNANVFISGNAGNDSIVNGGSGNYVTLANSIDSVTIDGGDGDDIIWNDINASSSAGQRVSIKGGNGNDWIGNDGSYSTLIGGKGNDTIQNFGQYVSISGGSGNDSIVNSHWYEGEGNYATIDAGTGNDFISLGSSAKNNVIKYSSGDGNDIVYGFNSNDTLRIGDGTGTYSRSTSGSNVIVKVGSGKITLVGAANKTVNIKGNRISSNSWQMTGRTTATYGTTSNTLVTVTGVTSTGGLSINTSDKVVTVSNSSLNESKVSIKGSGYTLALGSNVDRSSSASKSWSYSNSTATATYKQSGATGYSVASNGKSISYISGSNATLAAISGVKSKNVSLSGNVITVPQSIISSSKNVSLRSSDYEYNFAAGNYNRTSIKGSSSADKITSRGSNVSINGYAGKDTIKSFGTATTIAGGTSNDLISLGSNANNNVIVYNLGDGNDTVYGFDTNDKIRLRSGVAAPTVSGDDVVFYVGLTGSITLKDAKNKTISYITANGVSKTYSGNSPSKPYTVNRAKTAVTLSSSYSDDEFKVTDISGGSRILTINASAVTHKLDIKGNYLRNKIIAGSGGGTLDAGSGKVSDTLVGGDGADVFLYYKGDGNDVIQNYEAADKIEIAEGVVSTIRSSRENVIFEVGNGQITLEDARGKRITYIEDGIEYGYLKPSNNQRGKKTFTIGLNPQNTNDTIAALSNIYWKESFDLTNLGNRIIGNAIKDIDASAVTRTLKITGNSRANQILGSSTKANTIKGGGGDDTVRGGSGKDVFVYAAGDGNDRIVGFDESDKISITSGIVSNATVNSDNDVVLTVGNARINVVGGAGKEIKYYDDNHRRTAGTILLSAARDNVWFVEDDMNCEVTPNDLSSIVQNNSANYSIAQSSSLSLSGSNDSLAVLTSTNK